jgi:DNA-directed RNA polymerase subunit RPC12/RpoP
MPENTKGRCWKCGVVFVWQRNHGPKVRDAWCPVCGDKLLPTTWECKSRRVGAIPISCGEAMRKRRENAQ